MNWPEPISEALRLPSGACFYKCALQVNPYDYVKRHSRSTRAKDESEYNQLVIDACKTNGIQVIAVTDHYRVKTSETLREQARKSDICVFPGFEAVTKEGVHLLCLFSPDTPLVKLERYLGDCGVHDESTVSPTGKYDVTELLEEAQKWGSVCIAAHVAGEGGLLRELDGQTRMNVWRHPYLLACSLPGPVQDAPEGLRHILKNKDAQHCRERPVAILNANDVSKPEDLAKPSVFCWIKMSEISIDGLRQAFIDPRSRIRLAHDPIPEDHTEFVTISWQGGFLDGSAIHFNENLNVLIGGRGTGKSTVVESVRYVLGLEPLGEEARKVHDGIIRQVLRGGTKVSLLVRSHRPAMHDYLIERTIPNPPVVRDDTGRVISLSPTDIAPQAEVYGQHEISELTKSPEKLTRLLERFVDRDPSITQRKGSLTQTLERSRVRILEVKRELRQIVERLASLPTLEETLKRFQQAGLEDKLKEQSLLLREERILRTAGERIVPFREILGQLRRAIPIDRAFISVKALEGLPGKEILTELDAVLDQLDRNIKAIVSQMAEALEDADGGHRAVSQHWESRKKGVQAAYEKILRELQKSKVDGEEFIRLRRQIEELRPLKDRQNALQRDLNELEDQRRNLLAEWEDIKASEYQQLERAAKKVNKALADRVRVQVTAAGNRESLYQLLREHVGGRLSETLEILKKRDSLSLREFADSCRTGREVLTESFLIPPAQAERLAQAPLETFMEMEELDLPPTTAIKLNVAGEGQTATWQALDDLSTGQKATAVLLLLLLESEATLVVDQPEDDLDNRFITEGVVPKMREEKCRRQFLFATHNANIPVLGDAELIVGLRAAGEASEGRAEIPVKHMGSIDARPVRELVEEVLEGGREAFETRRLKYGF
ncbi:MAG: AAA family ATPase [Nitrospira sp.]|nr:AAA family ATPase [Nitrospira sp.]MDE0404399.1 AAA family ATPase [Nitrospira sp.]